MGGIWSKFRVSGMDGILCPTGFVFAFAMEIAQKGS